MRHSTVAKCDVAGNSIGDPSQLLIWFSGLPLCRIKIDESVPHRKTVVTFDCTSAVEFL